jgi:hypothetical protein
MDFDDLYYDLFTIILPFFLKNLQTFCSASDIAIAINIVIACDYCDEVYLVLCLYRLQTT